MSRNDDQYHQYSRGFILRCNISACKKMFSTLNCQGSEQPNWAWITICNHIFCSQCSRDHLKKIPATCPICSHQLTSPYDILETELQPPTHFLKMVLVGLPPEDCMKAAYSGVQFWETQQNLQINYQDCALEQAEDLRSHYEERCSEMSREIAELREENYRFKEELSRMTPSPATSLHFVPENNNKSLMDEQDAMEKFGGRAGMRKISYPPPSIPTHTLSSTAQESGSKLKQRFLGKH